MRDTAATPVAAAVTRATVRAAAREFRRAFGASPAGIAHAPGRVNLIGDHTDYNDGFALPLALQHGTAAAFQARDDGEVHCVSADVGERAVVDFGGDINPRHPRVLLSGGGDGDGGDRGAGNWQTYLRGVLVELRAFLGRAGDGGRDLRGANLAVKTALPLGAGLSSSAAFEVAILRALCRVNGIKWRAAAFAEVARLAENRHAGVQCGIMDPLVAAAARAGHALFIDCRSLRRRHIKLPANWRAVALDTATRRDLQTSAYNRRREACAAAAAALGAGSLREVSAAGLRRARGKIDPVLYRRARHVVTENARARAVAEALAAAGDGDLSRHPRSLLSGGAAAIGELFAQSQLSMTRDFEVGGDALSAMVAAALAHPACFAARQTGGGFAGCAVALVDADARDFAAATARRYRRAAGLGDRGEPAFYPTSGGQGARVFRPDLRAD